MLSYLRLDLVYYDILKHQKADHCFRYNSTQWELPTELIYIELINVFKINKMEDFREYESLRKEYESLRKEYESLRYTHNLDKNHNNIWKSKIYNQGNLHLAEKPLDVIERIIKTSSNKNDLIIDCFSLMVHKR